MLQLCYASRSTVRFDAPALTELLTKARANNSRAAISGMLLHEKNSFIQLLEGDDRIVIQTYNRIRRDPRHNDLAILFKEQVATRSFPTWDMGFFNADTDSLAALPGFIGIFGKNFSIADFRKGDDMAKMIFVQFRNGLWHRADAPLPIFPRAK
jgi:hypothetical protein